MPSNQPVILYVDDDPDFLDSVKLILESNGYTVVAAPSAEAGVREYKKTHPDLVIVDLMMEEVDSGASFVKELRLLNNTAPILMMSSAGDQLFASTDTADLGLAGVFQKPVHPDRLLATVREKLKMKG